MTEEKFKLNKHGEMEVIAENDSVRIFPTGDTTKADVIAEFAKHGYEISEEALEHNYKAWSWDCKSAYVENGVELFTPCGCNPLSFTAFKARPESHTYIC